MLDRFYDTDFFVLSQYLESEEVLQGLPRLRRLI